MQRRLLLTAGLMLIPLALASACGSGSKPKTGGAPAAVSPRPLTKLTVSQVGITGNFLPAWYAKDKGLFEKNGLDVDFVSITGSAGLPALLSGQTQIAYIGGTEVLDGALGGADPVAFMNLTGKQIYTLEVAPEIKAVQDLKGKKIGVSSFGSTSDTATRQMLQLQGLDPNKDVTLVAAGTVPNRTAAMISGAIQGDLTDAPDSFDLERKGFHPLIDLSDLNLPIPLTSFAAKKSYIDAHRDVIQKFTDSMVQATAQSKNDKPSSVAILKKYFKSDDDELMSRTYDHILKTRADPPVVTADQFSSIVDQIAQKNPKARDYDISKAMDPSFVKSAVDRGLAK